MAYNPDQPRANDGKWTGAGGSAGNHAAGTNNVGKQHVSPKALDVIRKNPNAFSVTKNGDVPNKGYMVALQGRERVLSDQDLRGPAAHSILNDFARKNADVLNQPGAHIGGWRDQATGKVYLDVSHNITRQREAVKTGKANNQIAIWDVKRQREIRTGGTGK